MLLHDDKNCIVLRFANIEPRMIVLYILFWLERGIIPCGSIYNKMSKKCILHFVVTSLEETYFKLL